MVKNIDERENSTGMKIVFIDGDHSNFYSLLIFDLLNQLFPQKSYYTNLL